MPEGHHHTIVDRLAADLLLVLRDHLSTPEFRLDRLALHILLTLSQKVYVDQLLFRDFDATPGDLWKTYKSIDKNGKTYAESIHGQAFVYAEELLARRLTLAQHLNDKPTNMHVLFAAFCRYGPDKRWQQTTIGRDRQQQQPTEENLDFFHTVAVKLADKLAKLGNQCTDIAKSRRAAYGSLWLKVDRCAAEVPEELSLTDVLEILSKPLMEAFAKDPELRNHFFRVLDSLNERYMLLRSIGLNPSEWLARSKPSINQLRDLKQLRRQARTRLANGKIQDLRQAYQQAFHELGQGHKWAGFGDFTDFEWSEVGRTMLRYTDLSLDESRDSIDDEGDTPRPRSETLPDESSNPESTVHFELQLQTLLREQPELFEDAVTRYCFWELLGNGRPLRGPEGVLQDPDLHRLIKVHPSYAGLSENALADRLWHALNDLIKRARTRIQQALTGDENNDSSLF